MSEYMPASRPNSDAGAMPLPIGTSILFCGCIAASLIDCDKLRSVWKSSLFIMSRSFGSVSIKSR